MELNITHLQHYPIGGENALMMYAGMLDGVKLIYPVLGINNINNSIKTFINGEDDSVGTIMMDIKQYALKPLLLPISALYEEIGGEIGIVQLIHILSGADTPDIKKSRLVKIGSNYKVLYNSILDKDIWFPASLEYNYGKWSYFWNGEMFEFNQLALFDYLFSHHYDVYGLIDKGIAIDKRTV